MSEVEAQRSAPGVATVRLAAPDRKNALVGDMARELIGALRELDDTHDVGAVIISGGQHAFCAGAHRELLAAVAAGDPAAERDLRDVYALFETVRHLAVPTVAAVCGPAVGAGLNLALACGVRVAGENAYLRSMFMANGIHPAGGHLKMLQEIGGRSLAVRMAVLDEALDGRAAVAAGLAAICVPAADVEAVAVDLVRRAADRPDLARRVNSSIREVAELSMDASADLEASAQLRSLLDPVAG